MRTALILLSLSAAATSLAQSAWEPLWTIPGLRMEGAHAANGAIATMRGNTLTLYDAQTGDVRWSRYLGGGFAMSKIWIDTVNGLIAVQFFDRLEARRFSDGSLYRSIPFNFSSGYGVFVTPDGKRAHAYPKAFDWPNGNVRDEVGLGNDGSRPPRFSPDGRWYISLFGANATEFDGRYFPNYSYTADWVSSDELIGFGRDIYTYAPLMQRLGPDRVVWTRSSEGIVASHSKTLPGNRFAAIVQTKADTANYRLHIYDTRNGDLLQDSILFPAVDNFQGGSPTIVDLSPDGATLTVAGVIPGLGGFLKVRLNPNGTVAEVRPLVTALSNEAKLIGNLIRFKGAFSNGNLNSFTLPSWVIDGARNQKYSDISVPEAFGNQDYNDFQSLFATPDGKYEVTPSSAFNSNYPYQWGIDILNGATGAKLSTSYEASPGNMVYALANGGFIVRRNDMYEGPSISFYGPGSTGWVATASHEKPIGFDPTGAKVVGYNPTTNGVVLHSTDGSILRDLTGADITVKGVPRAVLNGNRLTVVSLESLSGTGPYSRFTLEQWDIAGTPKRTRRLVREYNTSAQNNGIAPLVALAPDGRQLLLQSFSSDANKVILERVRSHDAEVVELPAPTYWSQAMRMQLSFWGDRALVSTGDGSHSYMALTPLVDELSAQLVNRRQAKVTVRLMAPAPTGGVKVNLSDQSGIATLPNSVTIPAKSSAAVLDVPLAAVGATTRITIRASTSTKDGTTVNIDVPTVPVASVVATPVEVVGGNDANLHIELEEPAGSGGVTIPLRSDRAFAQVPATVTVRAGQTGVDVTVATTVVSGEATAKLTAGTKMTTLRVVRPLAVYISPKTASVKGGQSVTLKVLLNRPAPAGGLVATLSDNSAVTSVPVSVSIPTGAKEATFTVPTITVTKDKIVAIVASIGDIKGSGRLIVQP